MYKRLPLKMKYVNITFVTLFLLIVFSLPTWAITYTYDDLNRLTKVTYGEGQEINYTYDAAGNMQTVNATGIESLFTEVLLEGTAGNSEWYRSDVKVSLTVHSGSGGGGSGTTQYSLDGQNWLTYTAPFTVNSEGTTKIYYYTTSGQNVETNKDKDIKIDKTPPEITGTATTQPNSKGWYKTDVTVNFTATDSGSGIDTVTPDTVISTAGVDQSATGTATDIAGNTATVTVSGIKIDKETPTVNLFTR